MLIFDIAVTRGLPSAARDARLRIRSTCLRGGVGNAVSGFLLLPMFMGGARCSSMEVSGSSSSCVSSFGDLGGSLAELGIEFVFMLVPSEKELADADAVPPAAVVILPSFFAINTRHGEAWISE
ncbi:hypothetical protein ACOJBO_43350 [Rhizobium beringeri]